MRIQVVFALTLVLAACGPTEAGSQNDGGPLLDGSDHDGRVPDADTRHDGQVPDSGGTDGGCEPIPSCDVEFTYPADGATTVELRGDFATDGWTNGVAMTLAGDHFTATLTLDDGITVQYKFVVDGTDWREDPNNPDKVGDGMGGYNSVITVDCGGCTPPPPAGFDWRDAVMYFVLVDRFLDGDVANDSVVSGVETPANYQGGDLAGVLQKIDEGYFTDLGVNTLWLSSPVDNADVAGIGTDGRNYSAYHGYWPTNLDQVESRIGDATLLNQVVDAAHLAGIKVILDYVMNHVHQDSPLYAQHADWFWPLDYNGNTCVCGEGCSWDNTPDRLRCWFRPYLPDFNFQNTDARNFSVGNAIGWIKDTGVDGYRLDAVKHIETVWLTDLRSRLHQEVETGGQVFYLIGETFTGDRGLIKDYVDPATMLDGQFDFPLRLEIVKSILMRTSGMDALDSFLAGNEGYYGTGAVMGTFIGNHDLPRAIHLAENQPLFGEWDDGKSRGWTNQPGLPGSREPFERVALAYAFLLTVPGVPLIYYGDEIGMPGAGDPDNRRMMEWSGLSADQTWLRERIAQLVHIRGAHPALRRGVRHTLGSTTADVYVYEMVDGDDHVYVGLNRGDATATASGLPAGAYRELIGDTDVTTPVSIAPRSAVILVAQ